MNPYTPHHPTLTSSFADVSIESNRLDSALFLVNFALGGRCNEGRAIANFLLCIEHDYYFKFENLLALSPMNRCHADIVLRGYYCFDSRWPADWINKSGKDGRRMFIDLHELWSSDSKVNLVRRLPV